MAADYEVIMLSWEYPPRIVGGIAPHVYNVSRELAKLGVGVHVVTCDFPDTKAHETEGGVQVDRVDSYSYPTPNFATWVSMMNVNLQKRAAEVVRASGGKVRVTVTGEPNIAPPGWYMLFLTDNNGIPSVAQWVHVT